MNDVPTERTFGWEDRWVAPEADPRSTGGFEGERATLLGYLRDYRLTLGLKCEGLGPEDLARRPIPPSNLSLLGLIRHLADVERFWFREVLQGEDVRGRFRTPDGGPASWDGAMPTEHAVDEAWAAWREEVALADTFLASVADLGATSRFPARVDRPGTISVREVVVHLIEEYARHMGHADLLRERIDGRVGQ